MIKLAFNATALRSTKTGIGQYVYQLAKGLRAHPSTDVSYFYGSHWGNEVIENPQGGLAVAKSLVKKVLPKPYVVVRSLMQYNFNKGVQKRQPDLYHEPSFLAFNTDKPVVLTVHDLSWIRFPEFHPLERVRAMNHFFEPSLNRASLILTDSNFVRNEVVDMFGVNPNKILAIPLGVESLFRPRMEDETAEVLCKFSLAHGRYLLAVGTLEPRKNLQLVLSAFKKISPVIRKYYPLVIVGARGWHNSKLDKEIESFVKSGEVRVLGYLSREELAIVLSGSTMLVYPSVYEGFGLPPLEGMASAVPVISSNVSSIPEVVGDAGILIDPANEVELANAIEELIDDQQLRGLYSKKGLQKSRNFTWSNCVEKTVNAYQKVI